MVDICKCMNDKCKKRLECYRYMSISSLPYQAYAMFEEICDERFNYEWFYSIEYREVRELREEEKYDDSQVVEIK